MTPIKPGTALRFGLKLPHAYRQRWTVGISMAEVEENLRHNLPLLQAGAARVADGNLPIGLAYERSFRALRAIVDGT